VRDANSESPAVVRPVYASRVAAQLGASEKTIKVHRGQVMQKMKADSLAHVIHIAEKLGLGTN